MKNSEQITSIGMATMLQDGSIVLDLGLEEEDGTVGDGRLVYAPTDEHYEEVLAHLGGLEIGESKSVPPWVDENPVSKKTKKSARGKETSK